MLDLLDDVVKPRHLGTTGRRNLFQEAAAVKAPYAISEYVRVLTTKHASGMDRTELQLCISNMVLEEGEVGAASKSALFLAVENRSTHTVKAIAKLCVLITSTTPDSKRALSRQSNSKA